MTYQAILNYRGSNRQLNLAFMKPYLPKYFSSEWSFSHFSLPTDCPSICVFDDTGEYVICVCSDGTWYRYRFDASGQGKRDGYAKFLRED